LQGTTADERNLRQLAHALDLDESAYGRILVHALELTTSATYTRLLAAVTGMLDHTPIIDAVLLERLQTIAARRT
jgi:hypothetical protein